MLYTNSDGQLRSDAKNMYELYRYDVPACIRQEARRYNQGDWVTQDLEYILEILSRSGISTAPPCGTMACRAGWACLLTGRGPIYVPGNAYRMLGLDGLMKGPFFEAVSRLFSTISVDPALKVGTPAYAE